MFQQRHQIHMALFENSALRQVHLVHHEVGLIEVEDIEAVADRGQLGQEAADQPIGFLARAANRDWPAGSAGLQSARSAM